LERRIGKEVGDVRLRRISGPDQSNDRQGPMLAKQSPFICFSKRERREK
jgi:hypothetical protein